MHGQSITTYCTLRRAPNTPREVVGIIFRHRRLVVLSFLATFAGVVIATVLFGMKYEAQTEILVKRQRPADLVTTEEVTNNSAVDDLARAREINTEVELLKSRTCCNKSSKRAFSTVQPRLFGVPGFHPGAPTIGIKRRRRPCAVSKRSFK